MTAPSIDAVSGLVEELRALSAYPGDAYDRAADALEAQASELAEARAERQKSSREWRSQFESMHQRAMTAERGIAALESDAREKDEALAECRKFRDYENDTWRKAHAAMCDRASGLDRSRLTFETALSAIRRRAIFGPSIALSDLLDLTQSVAPLPADVSLCPHAPTYDAGLCCGHPDDCTFISPPRTALSKGEPQ